MKVGHPPKMLVNSVEKVAKRLAFALSLAIGDLKLKHRDRNEAKHDAVRHQKSRSVLVEEIREAEK